MNESVDRYFIIGDDSDDTFEQINDDEKKTEYTNNITNDIEDTEEDEGIVHTEYEIKNNEIQDAINELNNIIDKHKLIIGSKFKCNKCSKSFNSQYLLDEHKSIHDNEIENSVCICKKCGGIYENDIDYLSHKDKCNGINNNEIPTNENGKYQCPACDNKYSNSFYLGEHFIAKHIEYDEMRILDEKKNTGILGFPGFELLKKIGMVDSSSNISGKCKICYFDFEFNIFVDEMAEDNKNPLMLSCCNRQICHNCLLNCISINDNLICPFCMKDHTQTHLNYITYITESDITNREKWLDWWSKHIEIFY
ncbi:hypothetical protein Indivirus_2_93 [Indivirus ILV1]|uniref:C2H2-type domain-containing protein n=1 Tax=Indivirus ILV1 TaxID=1977633 RepID=A0A1V0SDL1_9VIRU|nr:hypothetical protein Indivirus_2_93 [Indivirus ILV1]